MRAVEEEEGMAPDTEGVMFTYLHCVLAIVQLSSRIHMLCIAS